MTPAQKAARRRKDAWDNFVATALEHGTKVITNVQFWMIIASMVGGTAYLNNSNTKAVEKAADAASEAVASNQVIVAETISNTVNDAVAEQQEVVQEVMTNCSEVVKVGQELYDKMSNLVFKTERNLSDFLRSAESNRVASFEERRKSFNISNEFLWLRQEISVIKEQTKKGDGK